MSGFRTNTDARECGSGILKGHTDPADLSTGNERDALDEARRILKGDAYGSGEARDRMRAYESRCGIGQGDRDTSEHRTRFNALAFEDPAKVLQRRRNKSGLARRCRMGAGELRTGICQRHGNSADEGPGRKEGADKGTRITL